MSVAFDGISVTVASPFDHLCEVNAVAHNPVRGVKRPKAETNEGKTPVLGDGQGGCTAVV